MFPDMSPELLQLHKTQDQRVTEAGISVCYPWQPQDVQQENKTDILPLRHDTFVQLLGLWWPTGQNVSALLLYSYHLNLTLTEIVTRSVITLLVFLIIIENMYI